MELIDKYPVQIYNSLKREKELFKPVTPGYVGMYVCGPTVYSDPHLGHARVYISFDIVFRYLLYLGYKVRYVRNITDVGHLEDEVEGAGEDRIAKKAKLEKIEPMEVVQKYTNNFHKYIYMLNTLPPSIEPSASGHIIEQIDIIKKILDNGFAYEKNGSVYFDLKKYAESNSYGELSGKIIDDLIEGSRELEGQSEKQNSIDFALWKKAKPEHLMKWDSPWGIGFPGWHLECTAMSSKYLGVPFDIHGGGMDLQFPHHESEIAQCWGAHKKQPVNYWMHNNMITIEGVKMARSKNNYITLEELFTGNHKKLEMAYSPMTVRFLILQTHYTTPIDFSNESLQGAERGYKRLINSLNNLDKLEKEETKGLNDELDKEINDLLESCFTNMSDDFNTSKTLAALFDLSKHINSFYEKLISTSLISDDTFSRLKKLYPEIIIDILGLEKEVESNSDKLTEVMNLLLEIRSDARRNKDWATSDKIRDELKNIGIEVKDGKDGTTFTIN
ncbi:MAG: cysteine--tRNA ligase [Ignavibacteria bacterium]|jgi:cysteinyl-tRNA synthetase